jgi:hypothetical protein
MTPAADVKIFFELQLLFFYPFAPFEEKQVVLDIGLQTVAEFGDVYAFWLFENKMQALFGNVFFAGIDDYFKTLDNFFINGVIG